LIVTLPDLRSVLGATPLPGVSPSGNVLSQENLDGTLATREANYGIVDTASQYRSLSVTLTRWPTVKLADRTWAKEGHGPYREDAHQWLGATTPVTGLRGPGFVYQMSDGPFQTGDGKIEFDYVGPVLVARYRNVVIKIDFDSADFVTSGTGKVKVIYGSYSKDREEVTAMARKIVDHL
jgi:hypothetical protein